MSELPVLVISVTEQTYWELSGYHSLCLGGELGGSGGVRHVFVEWKMVSKALLLTFRSDNI